MGFLAQILASAALAALPATTPVALGLTVAGVGTTFVRGRLDRRRRRRGAAQNENGGNDDASPPTSPSVQWANLCCDLEDKGNKGKGRKLLSNAVGVARPGRLTAVMGPSGSGKTTLLAALAGRMPKSKKIKLRGVVSCGSSGVAYVPQDDIFFGMMTVRETLLQAAQFKLGEEASEEEKERRVQDVLKSLSLTGCADTIVGDRKTRGISGGEKKRLSIGLELLVDSNAPIFCDEPTTGLDSFQAEKVMRVLASLARAGRTVICTIHQPKGSIFALFDDVVLLTGGRTVWSGPIEYARKHFETAGLVCPEGTNLPEFFLDIISVDEEDESSGGRVDDLVACFEGAATSLAGEVARDAGGKGQSAASCETRGGWWRTFRLLYVRSLRQVIRDKATNVLRLTTNLNSALVFGSIYWRMGLQQSRIQDRLGLLQVVAINTAMASVTKTLTAFTREKMVVDRERTKGDYNVGQYLLAKVAAELPVSAVFPVIFGCAVYPMCGLHRKIGKFAKFLSLLSLESFVSSGIGMSVGSLVSSPEAANALGPAVMVIFIVFGGYYCRAENVPVVFRWIPRVSLIGHAFEGLAKNEFEGLEFEARAGTADVKTGEAALERIGFSDSTVGGSAVRLGRILLFNWIFTYNTLSSNKPKFQEVEVQQPPL